LQEIREQDLQLEKLLKRKYTHTACYTMNAVFLE